jgi:hypothetical protein
MSDVSHLQQQQPIKIKLSLSQPIKIQTGEMGELFGRIEWDGSSTATAANQN